MGGDDDPVRPCPACGCPHALWLLQIHCANRECRLHDRLRMEDLSRDQLLDVLSWIMTKEK